MAGAKFTRIDASHLIQQGQDATQRAIARLQNDMVFRPNETMYVQEETVLVFLSVKSIPKTTGPQLVQRFRGMINPKIDLGISTSVHVRQSSGITIKMTVRVSHYNERHADNLLF